MRINTYFMVYKRTFCTIFYKSGLFAQFFFSKTGIFARFALVALSALVAPGALVDLEVPASVTLLVQSSKAL